MNSELDTFIRTLPPGHHNMGDAPNQTPGFFHYTTYAGLLGIVESASLWATNIHHLNDYTEFRHGIDLARSALHRRTTGPHRTVLSNCRSQLELLEHLNIYVAYFCERGDLLSQWRGYSQGSGVSIGFRYEELREAAALQGFHILKCVYETSLKLRYIELMIEDAIRESSGSLSEEVVNRFITNFVRLAPAFKHPSFSEEREWRIISQVIPPTHPQVSFRAASNTLVPYFSFDLERAQRKNQRGQRNLSIGQVVLGPGRDASKPEPITALFAKQNIGWFSIVPSHAPYRAK